MLGWLSQYLQLFLSDWLTNLTFDDMRFGVHGHILKAGLDPGLWTLDSGLFPPKTFSPPEKTSISPPKKTPPPKKNSPQIKNSTTADFFPNKQVRSVRDFKQTTLFPPHPPPRKNLFVSP